MQLGSQVSSNFNAYTNDWEPISGQLSSGAGEVTTPCPKGCGIMADGGIAPNDALLLTGTGPSGSPSSLTLTVKSPEYGFGAYIEGLNASNGDVGTTFTVRIQAFDGVNSVLSSTALVTSDGSGDPIFVGVSDLTQEITKVIYTLTDANGNSIAGNFAVDRLMSTILRNQTCRSRLCN